MPDRVVIAVTCILFGVALPMVATIPYVLGKAAGSGRVHRPSAAFLVLWFAFALAITAPLNLLPEWLGAVSFLAPLALGTVWLSTLGESGIFKATPVFVPIVWQSARVVGGLFFVPASYGELTCRFAGPAGTGDLLVGLAAPLVASAYWRTPSRGPALGIAFNLLGISDFVVAIASAISARALLDFPLRLIPAYFVPIAILVHLFSIGNLVAQSRRAQHSDSANSERHLLKNPFYRGVVIIFHPLRCKT